MILEIADGIGSRGQVIVIARIDGHPGEPVAARSVARVRHPEEIRQGAARADIDRARLERSDPAHDRAIPADALEPIAVVPPSRVVAGDAVIGRD